MDIGRNLASAFRKGGETAAAATIYAMYVPPKLGWRDALKIDKKIPRKDTPGLKGTADRTPGRARRWTITVTISRPGRVRAGLHAASDTSVADICAKAMGNTDAARAGSARVNVHVTGTTVHADATRGAMATAAEGEMTAQLNAIPLVRQG